MLTIYLFSHKPDCTVDLSKIPSNELADECDNILNHHKECKIFFGFLEPGFMLDLKHEARIRRCIRKFDCHIISFHLESIPFSWKNEIDIIYTNYVKKDGSSEIINNGSSV